jgi:hypothetical protein
MVVVVEAIPLEDALYLAEAARIAFDEVCTALHPMHQIQDPPLVAPMPVLVYQLITVFLLPVSTTECYLLVVAGQVTRIFSNFSNHSERIALILV